MRALRILVVAVVVASVPSCGTLRSPPQGPIPTVVNTALECAKGAAHGTALGILDDVASALADGNWVGLLTDLAKRFTDDAVDCAVREVFGQSQRAAMASRDPVETEKAARAQRWLEARGRAP